MLTKEQGIRKAKALLRKLEGDAKRIEEQTEELTGIIRLLEADNDNPGSGFEDDGLFNVKARLQIRGDHFGASVDVYVMEKELHIRSESGTEVIPLRNIYWIEHYAEKLSIHNRYDAPGKGMDIRTLVFEDVVTASKVSSEIHRRKNPQGL